MESESAARGGRGQPLAAVAEEQEPVVSSRTMERVAAAKKIIENGYRERTKNLRERNERYHHRSFLRPQIRTFTRQFPIPPRVVRLDLAWAGMIEGRGATRRSRGWLPL
jgi:hypothetical protein